MVVIWAIICDVIYFVFFGFFAYLSSRPKHARRDFQQYMDLWKRRLGWYLATLEFDILGSLQIKRN